MGAGVYAGTQRDGAMHGRRTLLKELRYGSDGGSVYLRVDFAERAEELEGLEIQVHPEGETRDVGVIRIETGAAVVMPGAQGAVLAAYRDVLEIAVGFMGGVRLSFWQDGLPIRMVPNEGSLG